MAFNTHIPLHFELVNKENRKEIEALTVFSEQASFIESVKDCLQEADAVSYTHLDVYKRQQMYSITVLISPIVPAPRMPPKNT